MQWPTWTLGGRVEEWHIPQIKHKWVGALLIANTWVPKTALAIQMECWYCKWQTLGTRLTMTTIVIFHCKIYLELLHTKCDRLSIHVPQPTHTEGGNTHFFSVFHSWSLYSCFRINTCCSVLSISPVHSFTTCIYIVFQPIIPDSEGRVLFVLGVGCSQSMCMKALCVPGACHLILLFW